MRKQLCPQRLIRAATRDLAQGHALSVARFGRIQVIAKIDGAMRRLELNDPKVRKALAVVDSSDALVHLYETSGHTA